MAASRIYGLRGVDMIPHWATLTDINGEQMTLDEFASRQVKHTLRTGSADFNTMLGTLVCDECSRIVQVELAENGHWKLWTAKTLDKGSPFAIHSYCTGGVCIEAPIISIGE